MASEDAHKFEIGSATETVVVAPLANSSASVVTHETSTDVDDSGTGVPTATTTTTKTIMISLDGEGEESVQDFLEEIEWGPRGHRNDPTALSLQKKFFAEIGWEIRSLPGTPSTTKGVETKKVVDKDQKATGKDKKVQGKDSKKSATPVVRPK